MMYSSGGLSHSHNDGCVTDSDRSVLLRAAREVFMQEQVAGMENKSGSETQEHASLKDDLAKSLLEDWEEFRGNIRSYSRSFWAADRLMKTNKSVTIEDIHQFPQRKQFLRMFSAYGNYRLLPSWDDPQEVTV